MICQGTLSPFIEDLTRSLPPDPPMPSLGPADRDSLFRAVTARPWRRSSIDAATGADIACKLSAAASAGRPLEFSLPFGGYKGWRLPGAPHIDWAELFWIGYLREFAERLAELHAPGVIISLTYLRGVLGWVNNLHQADQDLYLSELSELLRLRSSPRVTLHAVDLTPLCGGIDTALALMAEREADAPDPTPAQMASAARNLISREGEADLSGPDRQDAIARAARRCAVMEGLEPRRTFNKFGPRIQITHVRGASLSLHLGSCRSGVAQPWVSTGYLEWRPGAGDWLERLGSRLPPGVQQIGVQHPLVAAFPRLATIPVLMRGAKE